mmetsp:Transcript_70080/g.154502  ORF Transcript_70080/g.154502 Transcript_70080/m.154502 type:complete len:246 (-) Transcript_70080:627-1364(-)
MTARTLHGPPKCRAQGLPPGRDLLHHHCIAGIKPVICRNEGVEDHRHVLGKKLQRLIEALEFARQDGVLATTRVGTSCSVDVIRIFPRIDDQVHLHSMAGAQHRLDEALQLGAKFQAPNLPRDADWQAVTLDKGIFSAGDVVRNKICQVLGVAGHSGERHVEVRLHAQKPGNLRGVQGSVEDIHLQQLLRWHHAANQLLMRLEELCGCLHGETVQAMSAGRLNRHGRISKVLETAKRPLLGIPQS